MTVDDDDEEKELEARQQAEVEFVSSAYEETEAWCDCIPGQIGSSKIRQVHRRLSLSAAAASAAAAAAVQGLSNNNTRNDDNTKNEGNSRDDAVVSALLTFSMPVGYPATAPLTISFAVEEERSKCPPSLLKLAYNALPPLIESCRKLATDMIGDEAVFTLLSHVDEWHQEEWPKIIVATQFIQHSPEQGKQHHRDNNNNNLSSPPQQKLVLGRRLIYSHHIISKVKRANMKDRFSYYQLTGFVKIGWPGLIIIEGLEENCQDFYDDIKGWNWKYLVVRGEQQEAVVVSSGGNKGSSSSLDSMRKFPPFQEVSDMSIVANHCREFGLEALFRTSMKVYDNTNNHNTHDDDRTATTATPAGYPLDTPAQYFYYGMLVWVDHMNDGKSYRKWLRKTAADTNTYLLIKQCFPNHDYVSRRPTILVAFVGEQQENVANFMKRWRTSRVDIDSKGKPCLERQMKVIFEGTLTETFDIDAIDWDRASMDEHLNVSKEQLNSLMEAFECPALLEASRSTISTS